MVNLNLDHVLICKVLLLFSVLIFSVNVTLNCLPCDITKKVQKHYGTPEKHGHFMHKLNVTQVTGDRWRNGLKYMHEPMLLTVTDSQVGNFD